MSGVPVTSWTETELLTFNTVGDAILSARSICPDPCGLMNPPNGNQITLAIVSGSLPAGTYFVAATFRNQWGETLPFEQTIILSAAGGIQVTGSNIPPQSTVNLYFGTNQGQEVNAFPAAINPLLSPPVTSFTYTGQSGVYQPIPLYGNAWLPDTDGQIVAAGTFFRWLNEGLDHIGRSMGGIVDRGGVSTVYGRGSYTLPSYWTKITNMWYDGWPLYADYRKNMFYYNAIPGIACNFTMNQVAGKIIVETWPQSERTANVTTLSSAAGSQDTTINVVNTNPTADTNVVNIGVVMIMDPNQYNTPEWCFFENQTGTSYTHLSRGVGGSRAKSWASGTPVYECNLMFAGTRMPTHYNVGESILPLDCPPNWSNILTDFLLYRFKLSIQKSQEANAILEVMERKIRETAAQKNVSRRGMLQKFNSGPPGVYPLGPFGSVIVP